MGNCVGTTEGDIEGTLVVGVLVGTVRVGGMAGLLVGSLDVTVEDPLSGIEQSTEDVTQSKKIKNLKILQLLRT